VLVVCLVCTQSYSPKGFLVLRDNIYECVCVVTVSMVMLSSGFGPCGIFDCVLTTALDFSVIRYG
jgi:hypothetical protein